MFESSYIFCNTAAKRRLVVCPKADFVWLASEFLDTNCVFFLQDFLTMFYKLDVKTKVPI